MPEIPLTVRRRDHSYSILVGGMNPEEVFAAVEKNVPAASRIAVVDRRVDELYGVETLLSRRDGWCVWLADAGEDHKNAADYVALCEDLLRLGVDRKTALVAVGGGVVGDIAGFAAATLLRGIRLVQVPTTFLAQVDSSVGGKTGVNMAGGKNLLGAFYQPELVVASTAFLSTLPEREYLCGVAETAKYGVLGDRKFFDELAASADELARRDPDFLARAVAHCCRMKADIVGSDELESKQRRLLNLGHTFGHALESLAGYDGTLLHGEAVSIGMVLAAAYSVEEGLMERGEMERLISGLETMGLPRRLEDVMTAADAAAVREKMAGERLPAALLQDKKAAGGGLTLILPTAVGACRIVEKTPVAKVATSMRNNI